LTYFDAFLFIPKLFISFKDRDLKESHNKTLFAVQLSI